MTVSKASDLNNPIAKELFAALDVSDPSKPLDAFARKRIAAASFAYWQAIDAIVPRPSPAESQWLQQELSTSDGTRLSRALSTPVYALQELSYTTNNCKEISKALEGAAGGAKTLELYLWLKLTQCYAYPDDIKTFENNAGLKLELYHSVPRGLVFKVITGKLANSINVEQ
ncbi:MULTISPECIES: hypothetical protein [unclassified Mesorhizobium]|uniref:hypothetical protein n=1 Tax=unclassified Mesorhizobium TaxID=325217 RepID=UPI0024178B02|nr:MULTISPECIES: hypothetical protein [unclassified Mesorhizobium]MDG4900525.1 hypothetical protein [Mesorhizobium sp. WSM4962]MDG4917239.1 hypothetical protein [Mesorhizobium sp. WSM4989]